MVAKTPRENNIKCPRNKTRTSIKNEYAILMLHGSQNDLDIEHIINDVLGLSWLSSFVEILTIKNDL